MNLRQQIMQRINKSARMRLAMRNAKKFTLPGFDGVPLLDVAVFFVNETQKDGVIRRAKSIAFTFFMAFFPTLIFLFSLIPFIPIKNFQSSIIQSLRDFFKTEDVYQFFRTTIENVVNKPKTALVTIGFLSSIWLASDGMMAIMEAFDKTYDYYQRRNFLQKRWVAFKLLVMLTLVFVLANAGIIAGIPLIKSFLVQLHIQSAGLHVTLQALNYILVFLLYLFGISAIYYYAPALKRKFRFFSTGSTVATLLGILLSVLFAVYVRKFFMLDKLYGSIASLLLVLIYFYLNAIIILIGFELNAAIYHHRNLRERTAKTDD